MMGGRVLIIRFDNIMTTLLGAYILYLYDSGLELSSPSIQVPHGGLNRRMSCSTPLLYSFSIFTCKCHFLTRILNKKRAERNNGTTGHMTSLQGRKTRIYVRHSLIECKPESLSACSRTQRDKVEVTSKGIPLRAIVRRDLCCDSPRSAKYQRMSAKVTIAKRRARQTSSTVGLIDKAKYSARDHTKQFSTQFSKCRTPTPTPTPSAECQALSL